jgi:hypothetical protein
MQPSHAALPVETFCSYNVPWYHILFSLLHSTPPPPPPQKMQMQTQSIVEPVFRRVLNNHCCSRIASRKWIPSRSLNPVHLSDILEGITRLQVQIQPRHRAGLVGSDIRSGWSRYTNCLLHEAHLFHRSQVEGRRAGGIEVVVSEDIESLPCFCEVASGQGVIHDQSRKGV